MAAPKPRRKKLSTFQLRNRYVYGKTYATTTTPNGGAVTMIIFAAIKNSSDNINVPSTTELEQEPIGEERCCNEAYCVADENQGDNPS